MRKLSDKLFKELEGGCLKIFVDLVKADDTLSFLIREDKVHIWYRGGILLQINNKCEVSLSEEYYNNNFEFQPNLQIPNKTEYKLWIENIPQMKFTMDLHTSNNKQKCEREFEQLVYRENNSISSNKELSNNTDYYITDLEYAAEGSDTGKPDMIGIKWLTGQRGNYGSPSLAIFEMKYGDGALDGPSGLKKHFKDVSEFVKCKKNLDCLYEECEVVFNQLNALGLIVNEKNKKISIDRAKKPEYILVISNHQAKSDVLNKEINEICEQKYYLELREKVDIKIARASLMGYGLYTQEMIDIEIYSNSNPLPQTK